MRTVEDWNECSNGSTPRLCPDTAHVVIWQRTEWTKEGLRVFALRRKGSQG